MKTESKKQKLTLAIDQEVIKRAKSAGINLSNITEEILHALTFDSKDNTIDSLVIMYEKFFDVLQPHLQKFGASVDVGAKPHESDDGSTKSIILNTDGLFVVSYPSMDDNFGFGNIALTVSRLNAFGYKQPKVRYSDVKVKDVTNYLYEPKKILEVFLKNIVDAAHKNKKKIQDFEFALKLVKTLGEGEDKNE